MADRKALMKDNFNYNVRICVVLCTLLTCLHAQNVFFAVFGLAWSIFIESLKVLVFSGVEKKMPEDVSNCLSPLCLVWP